MSIVIVLFAIGLVFLGVEIFVPGGILGALGGVALLSGVAVAFVRHGQTAGWLTLLAGLILFAGMLYFEFKILPKTALGKRFFLHAAIAGTSQPALAQTAEVVGKEAVALTPLVPSGYVAVAGVRYEAFSQSGHIDKGGRLTVVGVDTFRLIVKKPNTL